MTPVDAQLLADLQLWYAREARLLDERRYDLWLEMVDVGVRYQVPTRYLTAQGDVGDFGAWTVDRELTQAADVFLIDDDYAGIRTRIERLQSGMAWAEMPPSITRRIVGNVEPGEVLEDGGIEVFSALMAFKSRGPQERSFLTAQRRDLLGRGDGGFRLRRRTVIIDDTVLMGENLSIIL